TAFLPTEESYAHAYHKGRIVAAAGETVHTEAFHINWPPGAAVRVLPNSVTRGERGDPFASPRQVIGADGARPILLFSTDSPLRSMTGDLEAMALYAGEGAGRIEAIVPAAERLQAMARQAREALQEVRGPSSPVCYAAEAPDAYMGYADRAELGAELNSLLEAERAGVRVAARLVAEAPDPAAKVLAEVIHDDELRWCRALFTALNDLSIPPSDQVGGFYEKAMAIQGFDARLAFVNRGQGWVVRKLRGLLPRVRDDGLHEVLRLMLAAHERNIGSANEALAARGHADPAA
ncbi:MAG TPA: DUF6306 domain-containing protein, partial [Caulobacteraceae bacterium]|nr:DUF6306 domain-containing protein [Caulobacteraceae bacterium]